MAPVLQERDRAVAQLAHLCTVQEEGKCYRLPIIRINSPRLSRRPLRLEHILPIHIHSLTVLFPPTPLRMDMRIIRACYVRRQQAVGSTAHPQRQELVSTAFLAVMAVQGTDSHRPTHQIKHPMLRHLRHAHRWRLSN